jgi:hypothetical protein
MRRAEASPWRRDVGKVGSLASWCLKSGDNHRLTLTVCSVMSVGRRHQHCWQPDRAVVRMETRRAETTALALRFGSRQSAPAKGIPDRSLIKDPYQVAIR